jgi:hypothetical protein
MCYARAEEKTAGWAGPDSTRPNYHGVLGPVSFFPFNQSIFQILSIALSSKMQNMIFLLLQILHTLHAVRKIQIEHFFILVQLPNLSRFWITKFGRKSRLNLVWVLKGFKPLGKKSHKFLKILTSHKLQEYEFTLAHLYANFRISFTSGKYDLNSYYPKELAT